MSQNMKTSLLRKYIAIKKNINIHYNCLKLRLTKLLQSTVKQMKNQLSQNGIQTLKIHSSISKTFHSLWKNRSITLKSIFDIRAPL